MTSMALLSPSFLNRHTGSILIRINPLLHRYICTNVHNQAAACDRQKISYSLSRMLTYMTLAGSLETGIGSRTYELYILLTGAKMPFDIATDRQNLLIDGRRVPAASRRYFATLDPATEQVITEVAEADAEDVDIAVRSARAAFDGPWGRLRAAERGRLLLKLADLIRRDQDELVELESLDSGKPVSAIRRQDLPAVLDTLTYYAGLADKINGQVIPARPDALTYTVREPVGVVGAIVPWNFPLMIGMWKVAPALGLRLHGGAEAGREHAAHGAAHRRAGARGRFPGRRAQRRPRLSARPPATRWSTIPMSTR